MKIYALYKEDKLISEGSVMQLNKLCGVSKNTLYKHIKDGKIFNKKYTIKFIDEQPCISHGEKKKIDEKKHLDYLYRHLYRFGNTVSKSNPQKYIKKLKEKLNKEISVRKCKDIEKISPNKMGRCKGYYYVLEVE